MSECLLAGCGNTGPGPRAFAVRSRFDQHTGSRFPAGCRQPDARPGRLRRGVRHREAARLRTGNPNRARHPEPVIDLDARGYRDTRSFEWSRMTAFDPPPRLRDASMARRISNLAPFSQVRFRERPATPSRTGRRLKPAPYRSEPVDRAVVPRIEPSASSPHGSGRVPSPPPYCPAWRREPAG